MPSGDRTSLTEPTVTRQCLPPLYVVLLAFCALGACSKPDLSRDQAARQIQEHSRMAELARVVMLQPDGIERAVDQEVLARRGSGEYGIGPYGTSVIARANSGAGFGGSVELRAPASAPAVQVTGIAAGPTDSHREVMFSWKYQSIPPVVMRFAVAGGDGRAVFRRYDDGWRVENIDVSFDRKTAMPLSDAARREEQEHIEKLQQERRRVAEEKERREALVRESRTARETLGKFSVIACPGVPTADELRNRAELTVLDVGWVYEQACGEVAKTVHKCSIPFEHLSNWSVRTITQRDFLQRQYQYLVVEFPIQGPCRIVAFPDEGTRSRFTALIGKARADWLNKYGAALGLQSGVGTPQSSTAGRRGMGDDFDIDKDGYRQRKLTDYSKSIELDAYAWETGVLGAGGCFGEKYTRGVFDPEPVFLASCVRETADETRWPADWGKMPAVGAGPSANDKKRLAYATRVEVVALSGKEVLVYAKRLK